MKFDIDKQTANDLELFEKTKGEKSVFSLFNYTKSVGGKKRMEAIFSNPLTEMDLIKDRVAIIRYFQEHIAGFEIEKESLDFLEYYLIQQNAPYRFSVTNSFLKAWGYKIKPKNEYYIIQRGIRYLIVFLNEIYEYASTLDDGNIPSFLKNSKYTILEAIEKTALKAALGYKARRKFFPYEIGKLDYCFRRAEIGNIRDILDLVYEMDVYRSAAFASNKHAFTLPVFSDASDYYQVEGLFHPFIESPVTNNFEVIPGKNVCFITGPNMAGKSTFLKALGLSVYLAHLGFPIPAKSLVISKFDGLLTTINLSDNLSKGYSHFYNEVLRVKYVAERINKVGNMLVVFDELFRGTNVKDAYEASLSVISAFSKINKGIFAISTHIIEVAEKLKDNKKVFFKYFEANLVNETPQYNYTIKDGITDERIGMYILKKERVIETIEKTV
jgi:DNA mismatch repair ATPase MutS